MTLILNNDEIAELLRSRTVFRVSMKPTKNSAIAAP